MQQPEVWLVEDETSIADTLIYMLQQEGFAVKAFERGLPVLEEARRQLGLHASQCIYVGDDERDMQAGRAAGMRTVAARYGDLGAGACADDWVCDAAIDHPLELLKWLGCP